MQEQIKSFTDHPILTQVDCCFVVVMSHGVQFSEGGATYVVSSDDQLFPTHDLISAFSNEHCPALKKKAKVLLFQNCR